MATIKIGQRYGMLLVLNIRSVGKNYKADVLCDCGVRKEIWTNNLIRGDDNCGCRTKSERRLEKFEKRIHSLFRKLSRNAARRGIMFDIDYETWRGIVTMPCSYCGSIPEKSIAEAVPILANSDTFGCSSNDANGSNLASPMADDDSPSDSNNALHERLSFFYHGIDRIDNDMGYIPNNICSCCANCNYMKYTNDVENWLDNIEIILKHTRGHLF